MTCYEIIVSAFDEKGERYLLSEPYASHRATTETIESVRRTVLSDAQVMTENAQEHGIKRINAKVYEVTDNGTRVYIGDIYDKEIQLKAKFHLPKTEQVPGW